MTDFKSLIDNRVSVIAKVSRISRNDYLVHDFLLLKDVYINSEYFRSHLYIKRTKRLMDFKKDDVIAFTAKVSEYVDINDISKTKLGFRNIRDCHKVIVE